MEKTFALPEPLVRAIGNYLADRPYREVVDLLNAMQAAVNAPPPAPEQPPSVEMKDAA